MRRLHLNNIRLRNKLLLMYAVSVFIPIVLTNVFFYSVTMSNIRNQKIHDATIQMEKLHRELQSIIDGAVGISYNYYTDLELNEVLDRDFGSTYEYIEAYNEYLRNIFARYTQASQTVKWLEIYTENPTVMASGNVQLITEEVRNTYWYKEYSKNKLPYPMLIANRGEFSLVQRLDNSPGNITRGSRLVKLDLNMNTLRHTFENSSFAGELYFTGPDGIIQLSNDNASGWQAGNVAYADLKLPKKSIPFKLDYANSNYLNNWSIRGVMDERVMLEEVMKSRMFVIYLALANFVVPTVFLASMSRSIHVRLVRILKHMKKVKNQSFEPIPHAEYTDEIGQLTEEFNRMTLQIKSLIHDVYIADIQKKDLELRQQEAQLHALHSQINPHFLFNALETIRMRSQIKGEYETAKIIQNMAKMFRKSISWSRDWVTVQEELELIICFLEIQKYRFGDKLEYMLEADDEVRQYRIPKMTLIPYVENASIHGVESSPGKGTIRISIQAEEDSLLFRLSDNGAGMTPEKLEEVVSYLKGDDTMGEHVGMKNAYTRLLMCFGDSFEFRIASIWGEGTEVRIRMPLVGKNI
ncbi:sensor histidine kinase [Gorillibacterium sp. sgz5001074]|uniref:sensor histidine kinase n=1 Tax=Gorillibacterium sp. sgz5001074 TaxID=3446695 RepID=UPI003F663829